MFRLLKDTNPFYRNPPDRRAALYKKVHTKVLDPTRTLYDVNIHVIIIDIKIIIHLPPYFRCCDLQRYQVSGVKLISCDRFLPSMMDLIDSKTMQSSGPLNGSRSSIHR
jgi:hypothetical protein